MLMLLLNSERENEVKVRMANWREYLSLTNVACVQILSRGFSKQVNNEPYFDSFLFWNRIVLSSYVLEKDRTTRNEMWND